MHLFPVKPAVRWRPSGAGNVGRFREAAADNPPDGAVFWFHLKELPKGPVTLTVRRDGRPVATYTGVTKAEEKDEDDNKPKRTFVPKAGLNMVEWDQTHDGATVIPGAQVDAGDPGQGIPAAPGTYTVTLAAGGKPLARPFELTLDPRVRSADGLAEQEALALAVRDDLTRLSRTVARIRAVQKQLTLRKELVKDHPAGKDDAAAAEAVGKKLADIEGRLHNPKAKIVYDIFSARGGAMLYSQLTWVLSNATGGDLRPTAAMRAEAAACRAVLDGLVAEFEAVATGDVAKLNQAAAEEGLPPVFVPPAK
jgi:hypothetical protein